MTASNYVHVLSFVLAGCADHHLQEQTYQPNISLSRKVEQETLEQGIYKEGGYCLSYTVQDIGFLEVCGKEGAYPVLLSDDILLYRFPNPWEEGIIIFVDEGLDDLVDHIYFVNPSSVVHIEVKDLREKHKKQIGETYSFLLQGTASRFLRE